MAATLPSSLVAAEGPLEEIRGMIEAALGRGAYLIPR
jgi:hypothetical protein